MTQAAESFGRLRPPKPEMPVMSAGVALCAASRAGPCLSVRDPARPSVHPQFRERFGYELGAYERVLGDSLRPLADLELLAPWLVTTALTLVVGYPAAFGLAFSRGALRSLSLASLFLPLAASVIVQSRSPGRFCCARMASSRDADGSASDERADPYDFSQARLVSGSANIFLPV